MRYVRWNTDSVTLFGEIWGGEGEMKLFCLLYNSIVTHMVLRAWNKITF